MPFPYLAGAKSAAESTDGSVPAAGAVPPAPAAPSSHKPAGLVYARSAASARGPLSSSRGSGPLPFTATPEQVREQACANLVDRAAERWLDERVRGRVSPERELELDHALAEYRAARERAKLPVNRTPLGGTSYLTCPDYPEICSHPRGECPADVQGKEASTASFKRIPKGE